MKNKATNDMYSELSSLYSSNDKSPTTLMELTKKEYNRVKHNCIHLTGLSITKENPTTTLYSNVTYGKNLSVRNKKIDIGDYKWYEEVNLIKTSKMFMMITGDKEECVQAFPNLFTYCTNLTVDKNYAMSGKIILMLGALPPPHTCNQDVIVWSDDIHDIVHKCKENQLKSYDHHASKGYVYSFGNKPLYGRKQNSSVGVYTNRKNTNVLKQESIDATAAAVEELCSSSISYGIEVLSRVVPEIGHLLSPIVDVANKITNDNLDTDKLLMEGENSSKGCWNAMLNVNGKTELFHTERDCTYTFITVPHQVMKKEISPVHKPYFIFKANSKTQILIPLVTGLSFVYNARFLTHRQAYNHFQVNDTPIFLIYHHMEMRNYLII